MPPLPDEHSRRPAPASRRAPERPVTSPPTDYKHTLNLPKTAFPMRAQPRQARARDARALGGLRARAGRFARARRGAPTFLLHDGPPYANGDIHHGHILNKTLKDFIVKFRA